VNPRRTSLAAFAAGAALLLTGCPGSDPNSVRLAGQRYEVELATTDAARERGLMFVEHMPKDHGMLFTYDDAAPRAFWMKNCRIPLDILYFDGDARFVSAQYRVPVCQGQGEYCPNYPSDGAARYVLELNAGVGEALGLKPGAPLTLPPR
jgi:uncharacterized membrane protein (UPF0127 family)